MDDNINTNTRDDLSWGQIMTLEEFIKQEHRLIDAFAAWHNEHYDGDIGRLTIDEWLDVYNDYLAAKKCGD